MNLSHVCVERESILVHAWASREGVVALHVGDVPTIACAMGAQPVSGIAIEGARASALDDLAQALEVYLRGEPLAWDGALDVRGIPEFSCAVFDAVRRIPFGRISTYGAIAREIGRARAGRAVGTALHRNPFPIVVPCHRVIKDGGAIGGFACGVAMKRRLLALEAGQRAIPFPEDAA